MKLFLTVLMFSLVAFGATVEYSAGPVRKITNAAPIPTIVQWTVSASGDVGRAFVMPEAKIVSFQSQGTFNSGRVTIEGSNDCVNFHILNDLSNTAVSMTGVAIKTVSDRVKCYRPRTQGAASVDITTTLMLSN